MNSSSVSPSKVDARSPTWACTEDVATSTPQLDDLVAHNPFSWRFVHNKDSLIIEDLENLALQARHLRSRECVLQALGNMVGREASVKMAITNPTVTSLFWPYPFLSCVIVSVASRLLLLSCYGDKQRVCGCDEAPLRGCPE